MTERTEEHQAPEAGVRAPGARAGDGREGLRSHPALARVRALRARVRRHPRANLLWRIGIGVLGAVVLVLGVIAIPYPGPGWLIVFAGLGILATEFAWAGRLLRFVRRYYDRWSAWLGRQSRPVKLLVGVATAAVVLVTLWLLGALGLVAGWVGLGHWTWLRSPLGA